MTIEINKILKPNSASPTIIGRGFYNGKPAFFKIFQNINTNTNTNTNTNSDIKKLQIKGLDYEVKIYEFISKQKEEFKQYFIPFLGYFKTTLRKLVEQNIIKIKNEQNKEILNSRMKELELNWDSPINVLVTEDTQSEPLENYLDILTNDVLNNDAVFAKKILSNIFDLVLQGIKVLNNNLQIQHNDMHFGNILLKVIEKDYPRTNPNMVLKSRFKISIYDFDLSYHKGNNNLYLTETNLCETGSGCNTISFKDYFVFVQSIIKFYLQKKDIPQYSILTNYLYELLKAIVPDNVLPGLIDNMVQILTDKKDLHWSSFCMHVNKNFIELNYPCSPTQEQDKLMPWLGSIYDNFKNFTNDVKTISDNNPNSYYYKKYLKYKNKYLALKKI